jgi:para-nitrobenzyl esterase
MAWWNAAMLGLGLAVGVTAFAHGQAVERPLAPMDTQEGKISGQILPSGVRAWLGIPFAAAPVNDLRWRAPQPIHWNGVRHADRLMPECIQTLRKHDINNYFGEEATSEDCLYLNVWAPANARKLPVIVFIFGGGNTIGSAGMRLYNGENVARHGAVFVGMNYRVGILGFLAHPELTAEQSGHSGNYAYLDQNAALRWVKANIARFGGDPARVSIIGQSAGAQAVALHIASPLSKGLFSSAVMLSACRLDGESPDQAQAEQAGRDIQARLGAANLAEMRALAADKILAVQAGARIGSVVDGYFLPKQPLAAIRAHEANDVPVIASSNGDDNDALQSPLTKAATVAEYRTSATALYGDDTAALLALYPAAQDGDVSTVTHRIAQDAGMQASARRCAQIKQSDRNSATYLALFDRKHPYLPGVRISDLNQKTVGAYHSSDVPYWLGTMEAFNAIRPTRAWAPQDRKLSDQMIDALIAFARSGNPSIRTMAWPAWSPGKEQRLVIGQNISVDTLRVREMDWLAAHPAHPQPARPAARRDSD